MENSIKELETMLVVLVKRVHTLEGKSHLSVSDTTWLKELKKAASKIKI